MAALTLTLHSPHKAELEDHRKFGHTIERIQHIALMSRINICYTAYHLSAQTVSPTIPCSQGIKRCVKYLAIHPCKLIFHPYNYCYGSNFIIIIWRGNQVEY